LEGEARRKIEMHQRKEKQGEKIVIREKTIGRGSKQRCDVLIMLEMKKEKTMNSKITG